MMYDYRLSTIQRADRILVIQEGRITDMGTHAELLRQRGHYDRLYTQQFRLEREQAYRAAISPQALPNPA